MEVSCYVGPSTVLFRELPEEYLRLQEVDRNNVTRSTGFLPFEGHGAANGLFSWIFPSGKAFWDKATAVRYGRKSIGILKPWLRQGVSTGSCLPGSMRISWNCFWGDTELSREGS